MHQMFRMLEESSQRRQPRNPRMFRMLEESSQSMQPRNPRMFRMLEESSQSMQPRNPRMFRMLEESSQSMQPCNPRMFRMLEESSQSMQPHNPRIFRMLEESSQRRQTRNPRIFSMLEESSQSMQPHNSRDELVAYEREKTDYEIALSLQEEEQKVFEQNEWGALALFEDNDEHGEAQLEEDEEFAMAVQESLDTESLTGSQDEFTYLSYPSHLSSGQRFQPIENEDVIIAQLKEDFEIGRMQLMEDKEERFPLSEIEDYIMAQLEEDSESSRMQWVVDKEERFPLSKIEDDIRAQLEEDSESSRMQWVVDKEERFPLNEADKIIAQLEAEEKRQQMQLMEDEELAVTFWVESFAETGKEDISQPDASSVSPGQGFALFECANVSNSQSEDVVTRRSSQFKEDEQLAIALQESLNIESPDQLERICAGCNSFGHGQFLYRMGDNWHPECFKCHECSHEIVDEEFSPSGSKPYHRACYKEHFHPQCEVCKNPIPARTEFKRHPFWMRKYCALHEEDGTPRCCSCERLEPKDMKYCSLDDGRKLCIECSESAIMDREECMPLYREIQEFFGDLDMKLEQDIPWSLVEQQALNEAKKGLKKGNHDLHETRGLTVFEENEVTVIFVLKGLPRLLLGNILAHEMMHSWLRLKGYHDLSPLVEEGICQVMAHLWLEYEIDKNTTCNSIASSSASSSSSSSKSTSWNKSTWTDIQHKLADCFRNQIETDGTPIYGEGFKLANQAVVTYGLESTLTHIQMNRSFPS